MPSYSNASPIWSGSSQSKASKFVGRMSDIFIGGPRGDGSSGGYYKTGYDPGKQGRFGGPAKNIYTWRDDAPAAPTPAPPPPPAPAPAPAPAPPAISDESKQYRADTLKILQQADERMKAFEAQRAADEAARVKREEIAAQSAAARSANQMRAGQAPNLQLQPASQAPTTGGTQPFKRRKMQFGGSSPYLSLAISSQL
jgi:hypothetical protein